MTHDEHRTRHQLLHAMFDELAADYLRHTGKLFSDSTVMEFMTCTYSQTVEPHEPSEDTTIPFHAVPVPDNWYSDALRALEERARLEPTIHD